METDGEVAQDQGLGFVVTELMFISLYKTFAMFQSES